MSSIEQLVASSFLSRVPEIMAENPELTVEQAIENAYDIDERFCYRFMFKYGDATDTDRAVVRELSDRVYRQIRAKC